MNSFILKNPEYSDDLSRSKSFAEEKDSSEWTDPRTSRKNKRKAEAKKGKKIKKSKKRKIKTQTRLTSK